MPLKKQTKITKAFEQKGKRGRQHDRDTELEREIEELKNVIQSKQLQLFQVQKVSAKRKHKNTTAKPAKKPANIKAEKAVLESQVYHLGEKLWLYGLISGLEVNMWEEQHKCCIVFHIQHYSDYTIRHALNIDMSKEPNQITQFSLPDGFNFESIISNYSDVMEEECIMAIQQGLLAYYDRIQQCKKLDKQLPNGVRIFKSPDASDIEITLKVVSIERPNEVPLRILVNLVYRLNHTLPTEVEVICKEMSSDAKLILLEQCQVFRVQQLHQAFELGFLDDKLAYQCLTVKQAQDNRTQASVNDEMSLDEHSLDSDTHSVRLALISNSRVR